MWPFRKERRRLSSTLPIKESDLENLHETVAVEIKLNRTNVFIALSHRYPNMSNGDFVEYMRLLEIIYESTTKENPIVSIHC